MKAALRFLICLALLLGSFQSTEAASPYGSDGFSSAISPTQWTAVQANRGNMAVVAANGHASFLVTGSSIAEQNAYLIWNGRPTANVDWSVEVRGRNAVPYSSGGGSSIQLVVADARAASGAGAYNNFSVEFARTDSAPVNGRFQYGFSPGTDPPEGQVVATSPVAEFRLRVIYRAGAKQFESWYDDTGLGTNWKFLWRTPLSELIPAETTTSEIAVALLANTYHGPVSEGQLWVDDFRLVNTLLDVPVITTQPVGLTVGTGSVATFSVSATGTGLGYQWRKNGVNIAGGTSAVYSIGSAQLADAGTYSVVVSNDAGSVNSGTASLVLNVNAPVARSLALSTDKTSMAVDLLESDPLQVTVSGFLTNDRVRVGVYWDVNRNGVIDPSEPLAACYNLTDGLLPKIGGVRNGNVPGDEDGVVNGSITAVLRGAALGQISAVEGDAVLKVWCEEDPSKEVTKTVNVRFPTQPQRIIGTVMDEGDRPVPGAVVLCSTHLNGGYMSAYCFADANGKYSIPVPPGTYRLIYAAQNYWHDPFMSQSAVDVKAGKNAYVNGVVCAYTPERRLSGRVLTKDTNEPVRGLMLYVGNASGKITYVCTGKDGSFSMDAGKGPLGFDIPQDALSPYGLVWALDHSDPSRPAPASFSVDLTGGDVLNLTLKLAQTADALFAGTLQGSDGSNVVSLAGTHLRSRNYLGCDWEVGTSARVLGDGRFWLATYSGTFDLDIEDDERGVYGLISSPFYNGSTRVSLASGVGLQAVSAVTAPVGGGGSARCCDGSAGAPFGNDAV
jgi:hypothetical protein